MHAPAMTVRESLWPPCCILLVHFNETHRLVSVWRVSDYYDMHRGWQLFAVGMDKSEYIRSPYTGMSAELQMF